MAAVSLLDVTSGPTSIYMGCQNRSSEVTEQMRSNDAMSFAIVMGLSTFFMGLFAKIPLAIGPGLPFTLSFRQLMCIAPSLSIAAALALNLCVGLSFLIVILPGRRVNLFSSLPEDFRLGMASGIAAIIAVAGVTGSLVLKDGSMTPPLPAYVKNKSFADLTYTEKSDMIRMPILFVVGLVMLVACHVWLKSRIRLAIGMFGTIIAIATVSCIIRAGMQPGLFSDKLKYTADGNLGSFPRFGDLSPETSFECFQYTLTNLVEKLFQSFAIVTAVALLLVVSQLGYSKPVFVLAMNDSDKITRALIIDGLANVIFAPFLNTVLVSPMVESIAGIVAGSRTGFGACVAGLLAIVTSPVIRYILFLVPKEATDPGIVFGALFVIRCVRFVDFHRPTLFVPSLLCFILIPITLELGLSCAITYLILIFTWLTTKWWICINPQMIVTFGFSLALIMGKNSLGVTAAGLGITLAIITGICSIIGLMLFQPRSRPFFKRLCGNNGMDRYFEDDMNSYFDAPFGALPNNRMTVTPSPHNSFLYPSHAFNKNSLLRRTSSTFIRSTTSLLTKRRFSQAGFSTLHMPSNNNSNLGGDVASHEHCRNSGTDHAELQEYRTGASQKTPVSSSDDRQGRDQTSDDDDYENAELVKDVTDPRMLLIT